MPNINALFPSKYLKAEHLDQDTTLTMAEVTMKAYEEGDDPSPILHFREKIKPLGLNKTNGLTIASLYGEETDEWVGHQITLYVTKVETPGMYLGQPCIRVRQVVPRTEAPAPSATADHEGLLADYRDRIQRAVAVGLDDLYEIISRDLLADKRIGPAEVKVLMGELADAKQKKI